MHGAIFLAGAIALELFATTMLKLSEQFTRPLPTVLMAAGYILSFYLLSWSLKTLPLGIAYAIWSGVGIVLTSVIGAVVFRQMPDIPTILGIALIIGGVLVINLFSGTAVH